MNVLNSHLLTPLLFFSEINKMNPSKKTSGAVPTDKLKLASNTCYREITYHIDNAISTNTFPDILKLADVSQISKKGDNSNKEKFRPIGVLSSLSLKSMKGCYRNKLYPL